MRSIEEQADHMLRKMTVDMSIDLWQKKSVLKMQLMKLSMC